MKEANEPNPYHARGTWGLPLESVIYEASDETLQKWAHDPNCLEMEECAKAWAKRLEKQEKDAPRKQAAMEAEMQRRTVLRKELEDSPFNPRTEISADAIHVASRIVKHLWIIFVLLPFVIALLLVVVGVIK